MIVELPWPHRDLHPNTRVHWAWRAKAAKKARLDAGRATLAAGIRKLNASALHVTAEFSPPDARARDLDGMLSSIKPCLDGIADVVGVDDSLWSLSLRKTEPKRPHGAVTITIEVVA